MAITLVGLCICMYSVCIGVKWELGFGWDGKEGQSVGPIDIAITWWALSLMYHVVSTTLKWCFWCVSASS